LFTRDPRRNRKTLIELALLGLITAFPALKGPDFAFDIWVRRSSHEIGPSAAN
jgi:hypothetical protein